MYGGMCSYQLGQYDESLAHYDMAITNERKHTSEGNTLGQIYYNRGLSNSSLMRFEEAIEDHKRAIEAMSDNTKVFKMRFQLGVTLRRVANQQQDE